MSAFLVLYLDSIDERLLDYLDEDEELRLDVVKRLRFYASALLERKHPRNWLPPNLWMAPSVPRSFGSRAHPRISGRSETAGSP